MACTGAIFPTEELSHATFRYAAYPILDALRADLDVALHQVMQATGVVAATGSKQQLDPFKLLLLHEVFVGCVPDLEALISPPLLLRDRKGIGRDDPWVLSKSLTTIASSLATVTKQKLFGFQLELTDHIDDRSLSKDGNVHPVSSYNDQKRQSVFSCTYDCYLFIYDLIDAKKEIIGDFLFKQVVLCRLFAKDDMWDGMESDGEPIIIHAYQMTYQMNGVGSARRLAASFRQKRTESQARRERNSAPSGASTSSNFLYRTARSSPTRAPLFHSIRTSSSATPLADTTGTDMTAAAFPASEDFANGSSVLSSSVPLHLSLVESSSDRVYGTFEVSVIDVESENERDDDNGSDSGDNDEFKFANQNGKESEISPCGDFCHSQDCCFLMAFLCAPIRLRTYKALLFHVANFLVAVVSTACMTASSAVKLLAVCGSSSWRAFARRFESQTLSTLLQVDTALFNFVSPLDERVRVYSPTMDSFQDASEYVDLHMRLYFGVVKLTCSSVPGVISAGVFLWSLQHLFLITACALSSSSSSCDAVAFDSAASALHAHFLTTAEQDLDVLVLLAVLAVYGAAMLLQAFAYISRHVTVFFCAEYLRFAD